MSLWQRGWDWLVRANPRLTTLEDRRGSRLLAGIMLIHFSAVIIAILVVNAIWLRLMGTTIWDDRDAWVVIGGNLLILVAYLLVRSGAYRSGVLLYIAVAALVGLVAPFLPDPDAEIGLLGTLMVPLLITAMVFSPRWTVGVLAAIVVAAGMQLLVSPIPAGRAGTGWAILLECAVAGIIIVIFRQHLTRLEQDRFTELQEKELALRDTADRLSLARSAGKFGIWDYDVVNDRLACDERMHEIFGLPPAADRPPQVWLAQIHPDDRKSQEAALKEALSQASEYHQGFRLLHPRLGTRYIEIHGMIMRLADRKPFRLIGIISDVTEQRLVEQARQDGQRILSTLMQNLPGMAYRCLEDPLWTMEFVSEGCQALTGYPPEALIENRLVAFEDLIYPDDREWVRQQVRQALVENRPYQLSYRLIRQDGSECWVWEQGQAVDQARDGAVRLEGFISDITERVKAEEAMRTSERRFRLVVDNSPNAIFTVDHHGRVQSWNPACLLSFGYTASEMIGRPYRALFAQEEDAAAVDQVAQHVLNENVALPDLEIRYRAKDGSLVYALSRLYPLSAADGTALGCVFDNTDVTHRRALEEQLQLSKFSLDSDPDAVYWIGEDGIVRFANEVATRSLGYSREELLASHVSAFDTRHSDERWRRVWQRTKERGTMLLESIHRSRDGTTFPVEVKTSFVEFKGTEYVVAFARDIRERRRTEGRIQLQVKALESAANAIVITDSQGLIRWANPAFSSLTGYTLAEAFGRPLSILKSDEHEAAFYANLWQTILSGQTWHGELVNRRKDGSLYVEEQTITPVVDQEGELAYFIAIKNDVTEAREVQRRAALQDRLAVVGQLAAGIAHDFNNILGAISLYTQLLQRTETLSPEGGERLDTIRNQARRGADLVSQILDYSRRSILAKRPVDLLGVLLDLKELLSRTLPDNVGLSVSSRVDELIIEADTTRIQQALTNLVLNARDAMPDGGLISLDLCAIEVEAGAPPYRDMAPGRWALLTVADTGEGIAEDVLPHIFEPFFTTKAPGQGTGLGLAQVYGITKQHGGYIDVSSTPGAGTMFKLYFPIGLGIEPAAIEEAALPAIGGSQEKVLLVEDDPAVRTALTATLAGANYRVLAAASGAEVVKLLEAAEEVDLILSDLVLEDTDGRRLFARVHALRPEIPWLLMTGYPLDSETREFLRQRGLPWLNKPFPSEILLQEIQEALARAGRRDGARPSASERGSNGEAPVRADAGAGADLAR